MGSIPSGVDPVEAFEQMREVRGRNTFSGVRDGQLHIARPRGESGRDSDGSAGRGVPQRVVQQVAQDLTHSFGIEGQLGQPGGDVGDQVNAFGLVCLGRRVGGSRRHRLRPYCARVQYDLPLLGTGDGRDVVGQARQALGLSTQQLDSPGIQRRHAVLQRLEVGLQHRHRGTHLVSEIGQQSAAGLLDRAQTAGHLVEARGERVELRAEPWPGDSHVVMATGDVACRRGEVGDGPSDPTALVHAHRQRGRHRREQGQRQRDCVGALVGLLDVQDLGRCRSGLDHGEVVVEQAWADGGSNRPCREGAGQQHQGLGHEQATGEASPSSGGLARVHFHLLHVPSPMR